MSDVAVDLPSINDVMTKQQQAAALLKEELTMVSIGKNETRHTENQIKQAHLSLLRYFPSLKKELQREKVKMITAISEVPS